MAKFPWEEETIQPKGKFAWEETTPPPIQKPTAIVQQPIAKKVSEPYKRLSERNLEKEGKALEQGEYGRGDVLLSNLASGITLGAGQSKLKQEMPKYGGTALAGQIAGSLLPFGKAYQVASKIPAIAKIANPIGRAAATGLVGDTPLGALKGGIEAFSKGESAGGIAKGAAIEGAIFGGSAALLGPLAEVGIPAVARKVMQRFKGKQVATEVLEKAVAKDIGVNWENMNPAQRDAIRKVVTNMQGEAAASGKLLNPIKGEGPGFFMSDLPVKAKKLPKTKMEPLQFKQTIEVPARKLQPDLTPPSLELPTTKKIDLTPPPIKPKAEEQIKLTSDKKPFSLKNTWEKVYSSVFDSQKKLANISKDTKILASNSRQSQGVIDYIAESGMVNKEGQKIGQSLKELTQQVPLQKEENFWRYMGHKHNVARASEGKNVFSQYSPEDSIAKAQEILRDNPEFEQPAKEITKWINSFMDNWADDLVGDETLKLWQSMYPDYFPVNREVDELTKGFIGNLPKRGFVNQNNLVKKAKGAKTDLSSNIKNPLGNILQLVNKTVKAAKNNEVGKSILAEIRRGGLEDIFEIVPTKQGLVDDINTVLKNEGMEGVMTKFADQFDDVFKQAEKGNNIVKVMEGGKEVLIKVKDIEYLKALQSLSDGTGKSAAEQFQKAARTVSRPIKDLITSKNPLFAAFNIMRDTPTSFIQGQESNPIKFTMRYFKALGEISNNSKGFQEFAAQGGMQSGFFKNDVLKTVTNLKKINMSPFEKIVRQIEAFNNLTEATPRYMEYLATLEKGGTKAEGIYNAAEVTVNFARNGNWGKFFDSFVLYLNPALQGLDKVVRQVKNKPLQTALKAAGVITVPQLIVEHVNKDNPNYQSLDLRTKDDFLLIPNKFGPKDSKGYAETFFRVPKARQYGFVFAVLMNRAGQLAEGKPAKEALKGTLGAFRRDSSVPTRHLLAPFGDVDRNRDWKNAPINPLGMELDNRSNYLKYDETTSEIGKALGKLLNEQPIEGAKLSPKEVDYLIDSYTGIIGDMLLPATTKNKGVLDVPKKKFIVDSVYSNQGVTDFYDNLGKLRTTASDTNILKNIPSGIKTREENARNEMDKFSTEITRLNKILKQTEDKEKQREIRAQIVKVANMGNSLYVKISK